MREKFGVLSVYLSKIPPPEVQAILDEAHAAALVTCEVCGAQGRMADRHGWMSVKCDAHENWSPADGFEDGLRTPA
jgi:transcription elongation factor Elf1